LARCLDTSFLIDVLRGHPGAVAKAKLFDSEGEVLFLPAPVVAEFLDGAYHVGGSYLREALGLVGGRDVLPLDSESGVLAGRLRAELRRQGTPLPMLDVMIAAVCLTHHHVLVSRDADFARIPGLAVESY